jgi:sigma-E factor negative regulatory protein RseB
VVVAAVVGAAPFAGAAESDPIDEARQAAQRTPFTGVVSLQWRDGAVVHSEQVQVEGADGNVLVQGRRVAMARGPQRLLHESGGDWELWPSVTPSLRPAMDPQYEFRTGPADVVAGHPAHTVEVRKEGLVRERLYLDDASGLLLRREQFGEDGTLERVLAFDRITIEQTSVTAPRAPGAVTREVPEPQVAAGLPFRLAAGYQRLGAFRTGGVLHVLYDDGFSAVSLFEQRGRLDRDELPAHARRVSAAGLNGWSFSWPGGEAVVWGAGRTVYTLVGDVPAEELVEVAMSVPVRRSSSVGHRLRQACRSLVQAFSGDL